MPRARFHCSRGGYPSESLAKANSRRKVISVYGARLISYRSRIFIAATRCYARTRVCLSGYPARMPDTRLRPRDRIRSEGWKNTVAAVFCRRVESCGDGEYGCIGSATAHTPCFINCGSAGARGKPVCALRFFTITPAYYFTLRGNLWRILLRGRECVLLN